MPVTSTGLNSVMLHPGQEIAFHDDVRKQRGLNLANTSVTPVRK